MLHGWREFHSKPINDLSRRFAKYDYLRGDNGCLLIHQFAHATKQIAAERAAAVKNNRTLRPLSLCQLDKSIVERYSLLLQY